MMILTDTYSSLLLDSFRVPDINSKKSHTFEVFDKLGYNLENAVRDFCVEHSLNMTRNGPCCDILQHATHQRHMIRIEKMVGEQRNPTFNPHFGICIATHQRQYDLSFSLLHNTSLPSLLGQSYPHWTLLLIGDALTDDQEEIVLRRINQLNFPPKKIVYRNLDPQYSEKNIFKERDILPCAKFGASSWCHSGTGAMNLAMDIADTLPEVTHLLMMGDDDTLLSNHLANLARAFRLSEERDVKFAFTKGYSVSWSWVGFPSSDVHEATYAAPTPCMLFPHAAAWSKELRLRLDVEQSMSSRHMDNCCGLDCVDGLVLMNDADFFERVNTYVTRDKLFSSIFIPQIDFIHLNAEDRLILVEQIQSDAKESIPII